MDSFDLPVDSVPLPSRVELLNPDAATCTHAFRTLQAGLWLWDVRQNLFCIDEQYIRNLGYDPDSAPQTFDDWLQWVHPEDRCAVKDEMTQLSCGKFQNIDFTRRMFDASGDVRLVMSSGCITERHDGFPAILVGAAIDITGVSYFCYDYLKEREPIPF